MSYEVLMTSRAGKQLVEAAHWWAEHRDPSQALDWLNGFERAIVSLSDRPERHSLARENQLYHLAYPARQLLYGLGKRPTHRAVFEIRGGTVFVVAIRHLAQDVLGREVF